MRNMLLVQSLLGVVLGVALALAGSLALPAAHADDEATLKAGLETLIAYTDAATAALARGDLPAARAAYGQFDQGWDAIEDGVRVRSRTAYRDIERAMDDVQFGLRGESPDVAAVQANLATLRERVQTFAATLSVAPTAAAPVSAPAGENDRARAELRAWAAGADAAFARLDAGDVAGAQAALDGLRESWLGIEDDIRPVSRAHYREIERAMGDAHVALSAQPAKVAEARAALDHLRQVNASFLAGTPLPDALAASASSSTDNPTPATLLSLLDDTLAALDRGDVPAAQASLRTFQEVWLDVEGFVRARSAAVYTSSENRTAEVVALLAATPPNAAQAREVLTAMRADLLPVVEAGARYTAWDAAIILFREGFEALLVVAALIAFLQRSGNGDKRSWIWVGGAAGILASLLVAVAAQLVLSRAAANVSREVLEGVTGLLAAGMLLYVGYWLHSKASLGAWQAYVRDRSLAALQRNSLLGLALIAFLAVFREGAETVLFYVGLAPNIALGDLLLGLGAGTLALVVLAVLMLVVGVRIPVRPFFLAATVLIYFLCFKFVGMSIHALQVAGVLPATPARWVPAWEFFGLFPTWETTVAQLVLLWLIVLLSFGLPRLRARLTASSQPSRA